MSRLFLTVIAVLLVSTSSFPSNADEYRRPLRVNTDEVHSITFARLVFRIPGDSEISVTTDQLRIQFLEYLRSLGYPARGAENLVFGQDEADKARFNLGGTVNELECSPAPRLPVRRCRLGITWELLDRASDEVVYRTTTRHLATANTPEQLGEQLVWGALNSLLARAKFVDALRRKPETTGRSHYAKATFQRCAFEKRDMATDARDVLASTVLIRAGDATGSGVLISPDGMVLTAAHVVASASEVSLQFHGGKNAAAMIVRVDEHNDVALLRVQDIGQTRCLAQRNLEMNVGEELFAIGSPLGEALSWSLTRGIVSGHRSLDGVSLLQTDASVNPGNSGGPIVDKEGRWAAITSWKVVGGGVEGIAFGVPASAVFGALAIGPGDSTEEALRRPWAGTRKKAVSTVNDTPDPAEPLFKPKPPPPPPPPPKPQGPRTPVSRTVEQIGWIAGGAGVLGVAGSFGYYKVSEDELQRDGFDRARLVNDVSWVALVGGALTVVYAYQMPRQEGEAPPKPDKKEPDVAWTATLGAGSVGFGVRY